MLETVFIVLFAALATWLALRVLWEPLYSVDPTPENAGKIQYMDELGVCYRYHAIRVGGSDAK